MRRNGACRIVNIFTLFIPINFNVGQNISTKYHMSTLFSFSNQIYYDLKIYKLNVILFFVIPKGDINNETIFLFIFPYPVSSTARQMFIYFSFPV